MISGEAAMAEGQYSVKQARPETSIDQEAEIVVLADAGALALEAAERFTRLAQGAAASRGRFSVALSGGSTPGELYSILAKPPFRARVPWQQVHLFWGDERCVPPDEPGSNYRLAEERLISQVPIPPDNVHRVRGELEPRMAAQVYDRVLQDYFCGPKTRFDLVLLGLGNDGHTASLFPGSPLLGETERLAAATTAIYEDRPAQRVTLTLPAINTARDILFLVKGSDKAEIVRAVLEEARSHLPARRVRPMAGQATWLLDAAAASLLFSGSEAVGP
jgi:6-phosphogluconolactonase